MWQAFDEMLRDGMMETGDIMEQRGPRNFVWIDRKKNIMKLAQVRAIWQFGLLQCPTLHISALRGGIAQCKRRHATAYSWEHGVRLCKHAQGMQVLF